MTRSRSLFAGLLLTGLVLALAPATSSAQRVGFLGGRNRGVGVGSGYYGGGYGGYYGNGWGGYSGYGYDRGNYPGYGYSNYGSSLYGNNYPTYSGYSNYGYPNYSGYYGNSGLYGGQGMQLGTSDDSRGMGYQYGSMSAEMKNRAFLNVRLPSPDAEVWIEGDKTSATGLFREYMSPPLDPDKKYSYEIKARWTENGKEVTRTKKVSVRPNAPTMVDFVADRGDADRTGTDKDRDRLAPGTDRDRPGTGTGTDKDRNPGTDKDRTPGPDKNPGGSDK